MKFANMRRAFATSSVLLDKWYLNYVSAQASLYKMIGIANTVHLGMNHIASV